MTSLESVTAIETKFANLINTIDGIVWEADARNFKMSFVSDQAIKILGYPISNWLEEQDFWLNHVHPDDRTWANNVCLDAVKNKRDHQLIYRMIARDGRTVWLQENITIILKDGEADRLTGIMVDITTQKRTEEELKRLSIIAKHTNHALIFCDANLTITWVNDGFERITKFSNVECIGKRVGWFFDRAEGGIDIQGIINKRLQHDEGFKIEILYTAKDGQRIWFDVEFVALKDGHGAPSGYMIMLLNITNLKKVIRALMDTDEQLSSIMNNSPLHFYTKDLQGRYCFVSDRFRYSQSFSEPLEGRTVFDLFDPDTARFFAEKDREVILTDKVIQFEYQYEDGWFIESKFPIHDSKGKVVFVGGQILDVTENYKMRKLLEEKESQVRLLSDNIPNGFIYQLETGAKGHRDFLFCSSGVLSIVGITVDEVKQDALNFFKRVHRHDVPNLVAVELNSPASLNGFDLEFRILNANREYRWIHTRAKPKRLPNKRIHWDGYAIDITERKKAERALIASNKEKDAFLKEVHHRVKNYLQMVSSIVFLRLSTLPEGKEKNFLVDMRDRIKSISLIHEKLLHTNKINSIDIRDYISSLVNEIVMSYTKPEFKLEVACQIDQMFLPSDMAIYCGLIVNELVTNAFKHAFHDRTNGHINIKLTCTPPSRLVLVVEDDGIGYTNIAPTPGGSLGILLLDIFVKQINGRMTVVNDRGTKYRIECDKVEFLSLI